MRRLALLVVVVAACGGSGPLPSPPPLAEMAYVAYEHFVGDPDGSEIELTGYGVYAPALGRAAQAVGARVLVAGQGVAPAQVYDHVARQHPVVACVSMSGHGHYAPKPTTT